MNSKWVKKNGWFWRWDWDQQKGCDGMPVICHPELAIRHRQSVRCEMNKFDDMMLLGMKGAVFGNRVAGIVVMKNCHIWFLWQQDV